MQSNTAEFKAVQRTELWQEDQPWQHQPVSLVRIANLELEPETLSVRAGDDSVELTANEYDVLMALIQRHDRVVSRNALFEQVWGGVFPRSTRMIDTYVQRIRQKLNALAPDTVYIHTHTGIGYRFSPVQSNESN